METNRNRNTITQSAYGRNKLKNRKNMAKPLKMSPTEFLEKVNKYHQEGYLTKEESQTLYEYSLGRLPKNEALADLYNNARAKSISGEVIPLKILADVVIARLESLKDEPEFYRQELKAAGTTFLKQLEKYSNFLFEKTADNATQEAICEITLKIDKIKEFFAPQKATKTLEMIFIVISQAEKGEGINTIDEQEWEKAQKGLTAYYKIQQEISTLMTRRNNTKDQEEYNNCSLDIAYLNQFLK